MSKILFLNHSTVGHLNTLLNIALQMRDDGHDVRFLIPGARGHKTGIPLVDTTFSLPETIEQYGLKVEVMPPQPSMLWSAFRLTRTSGYAEIKLALGLFSMGLEHYTRHVLKAIETHQPDVLVSDFAFLAASIAAEVAGLPCVQVYHSGLPFRGEGIPPFGRGLPIGQRSPMDAQHALEEDQLLSRIDERINTARRKIGLPAQHDVLRTPSSKWLNLVTSVEALEVPRQHLPANTLYIGPCFSKRQGNTNPFPFDQLRPDAQKIYVSLGTVFNNKPHVFRKVIAGLARPDRQIIVSAGGSYRALMRSPQPDGVMLFKSVPQVDLLPKVDLVIGHGGNNSTNETLAAGKPLIVMPVGGEQMDNARRVEFLGAGLSLDIDTFSPAELNQHVEQVLSDPRFAQTASRLREAVAHSSGPQTASACVAWVAQHKQPLERPAGFGLNITQENLTALLETSNTVRELQTV